MVAILILLAIFVAINIWLVKITDSDWRVLFMVFAIIGGFVLIVSLAGLPIDYYGTKVEIEQFNALKSTIEKSRDQGRTIENAAFMMKIASANQWLAKKQYWNNTIFDIYIPDEVEKLKPLE